MRIKKTAVAALIFLTAFCSMAAFSSCAKKKEIILASTTSTQDSGLFEELLPVFSEMTGYIVKVIAVGTGEAIELGRRGEADVILVHSREAEDEFIRQGWGLDREDVMYNDFVIAGPAHDPAGISNQESAAHALKAIALSQSPFVSRGDDSGTHKKELKLWEKSGSVIDGSFYIETGQGMGESLRIADEKQAYILTDRGTWLAQRDNFTLKVLFEKDLSLFNPYGVIAVNPEKHPDLDIEYEGAILFIKWIISSQAQEIIRGYGTDKYGEPLFYPDAKN